MGWMSKPGVGVDTRAATIIVAASDSKYPAKADYQCDGVNDHIEIQAALDALPATGGEVKLLDGTYNCEVQINLDYNQTLRGCGRNTILTTSTANLIFLSAVGGSGTEKTGIVIADLQIDGGAGAVSDGGIYFNYVDYSLVQNVYSRRHTPSGSGRGIYLYNSDYNQMANNACQGSYFGFFLYKSDNNTLIGNTCQGNVTAGIELHTCNNNTLTGNTCQGNTTYGICLLSSSNNTVSGNTCRENGADGISLNSCSNNTISGNTCVANSQTVTNDRDDIIVQNNSDYNNIQGNTCRAGVLANKPRYGIFIFNSTCDGNLVTNNDLHNDGFGTGSFNDGGTDTVTTAGNRT